MLNHIKDLSPCAMTVFIREPVEMEKRIVFSRFYPGQARFAHGVQGGYELTDWGRMMAQMALDELREKAEFFILHQDDLHSFYRSFQQAYQHLTEILGLIRERRNAARHWHDQAILFRQQKDIEDQMESLYKTMYVTNFGAEAVWIDDSSLGTLLEQR